MGPSRPDRLRGDILLFLSRALIVSLSALASSAVALGQPAQKPLGEIELFGYAGLDVDAVRARLPLHEGDLFPPAGLSAEALKATIGDRVREVVGRPPTDVSFTCCDDRNQWMVYVGLPGKSYRPLRYNAGPKGADRLPPAIVQLQQEADEALQSAVLAGRSGEDDSQGYALFEDPAVRAKQLALREYALAHEAEIRNVLAHSSDARHRAIAAGALGYARRSERQVSALVNASLDADDGVRNDAVRALAVLAGADRELARRIPATTFVGLVASGTWSDHNKGAAVLEALSRGRDPKLLGQLRAEALDNLVEMARWRSAGHSYTARVTLGRVAGIEDSRLYELIGLRRVEEIIGALGTPVRTPER
jgi:hypothetical protein